jgi:hypothetical protein
MLSAGAPAAAYFSDNIHPNKLGAFTLGTALAAVLDPLISTDRLALPISTDARWLSPNPYLTGTASVSGSGYSGNLATSWSIPFGGAANTSSTLSKFTDAEGEWQRVVVTGTNRDGGIAMVSNAGSTIPAGTRFRMVMRCKGSGFYYFKASLVINSTTLAHIAGPGSDIFAANPNDLPAFDGIFLGPIMVMPGGYQDTAIWVNPSGQGTLDFRQCGILKVDDGECMVAPTGGFIGNMVVTGAPPALSCTVLCNAGSPFTVNLPAVATCLGREYTFVKTDASANAFTLDGNGSETINGAATLVVNTQWDRVTIIAHTSGWIRTK